jgi:peptide/nickel transport system permease protein
VNGRKFPIKTLVGLAVMTAIVLLVAAAPLFTDYAPDAADPFQRLKSFSMEHPFGTDRYGRDLFSRTLYGGRMTLTASFAALSIALAIGVLLGILTGLRNQTIFDTVLMRIVDVLMAFPFMVFAMVIAALWGSGLTSLLAAVVAVWWVSFARLSRSIVLHVKNDASVLAARVLGAPEWRIVFCELLPKTIGSALVLATFELGTLILSISALSFLGMGAQPPTPEWGSMLSDARAHFFQKPHVLFGPALFIVLTVLALNLIGEGLRDVLDPYEILRL